jgi:enoyl-CoA hydratase
MNNKTERRIEILTNQISSTSLKQNNLINTIESIHSNLNLTEGEVLSFLHPNGCLEITLNRHKAYNALNMKMIQILTFLFENAKEKEIVKFVMLTSQHPKAFCAGGDIKPLSTESFDSKKFFESEYYLDLFIAQFPKPVVCLINGIGK